MKKFLSGVLAVILCLGCMFGAISTTAKAEDIKVTGKVVSGTTANLIKLNTGGSEPMLIKIDGNTNFSGCTSLLPNTELVVMVSYGSDAYWHAVSVKDANSTIAVTLDTSNPSTVVGVLSDVKSADTVVLKMYSGEMHLKLDPTTDYSGTRFLLLGNTYEVQVARGSDAYMHAVSIKDSTASVSSYGTPSNVATPQTSVTATTKVSGTVKSNSDSKILYLATPEGDMAIKLDALTSTYVLYHNQKISVNIGYLDGYWHAVTITY